MHFAKLPLTLIGFVQLFFLCVSLLSQKAKLPTVTQCWASASRYSPHNIRIECCEQSQETHRHRASTSRNSTSKRWKREEKYHFCDIFLSHLLNTRYIYNWLRLCMSIRAEKYHLKLTTFILFLTPSSSCRPVLSVWASQCCEGMPRRRRNSSTKRRRQQLRERYSNSIYIFLRVHVSILYIFFPLFFFSSFNTELLSTGYFVSVRIVKSME